MPSVGRSTRFVALVALLASVLLVVGPARAQGGRGWQNPRALELAKEGIAAKKAGDYQACIEKDIASLALEEHPYVRLHLSSCYSANGRMVAALQEAQKALIAAMRGDDEDLKTSARKRVVELNGKVSHLTIKLSKKLLKKTRVTVDGLPVRPQQIGTKITMDPGPHVVAAESEHKGERLVDRQEVELAEGAEEEVEIKPKLTKTTKEQEECLRNARSYEEQLECVLVKETKPNVRVGLELAGYTDSTATHVLSPSVNGAVASPTSGWNVGASYLLDIVTAASPDIVSMGSRRFKEQRHAASANGGYKMGLVTGNLFGNFSREPDYLSLTLGGAVSAELNDKLVTPRLGFSRQMDTIGIRNSPFDNFKRNFASNDIEAGVTIVLSPTELLVTGLSLQIERGEQSKLYRYIPVFTEEVAATINPGAGFEEVNAKRLPMRPREQVPLARDRVAAGVRYNRRFATATLRADERVYVDTWGIKASTTDFRYLQDLGSSLRVWPHLRFNVQSGASFYRLAYTALTEDAQNPISILPYRSTDRELSPMMTITVGGGARIALSSESASPSYALVVAGELMYSQFFRSLFIRNRTATYGSIGLEVEF